MLTHFQNFPSPSHALCKLHMLHTYSSLLSGPACLQFSQVILGSLVSLGNLDSNYSSGIMVGNYSSVILGSLVRSVSLVRNYSSGVLGSLVRNYSSVIMVSSVILVTVYTMKIPKLA